MPESELNDDHLLKEAELAVELHVPPSRLAKARMIGDPDAAPPYIKLGHLVRYRRGDVRAWLAERPRLHSTSQAR